MESESSSGDARTYFPLEKAVLLIEYVIISLCCIVHIIQIVRNKFVKIV